MQKTCNKIRLFLGLLEEGMTKQFLCGGSDTAECCVNQRR